MDENVQNKEQAKKMKHKEKLQDIAS